jgi:starch synthase (maltosyl-transferring)
MPRATKRSPTPSLPAEEGRRRVLLANVIPSVQGGRYAAKRVIGDDVVVEADAFTDGHDVLECVLLHRREDEAGWREGAMAPLVNDRWRGSFRVERLGRYRFTVLAWVDRFGTWARDLEKRLTARHEVGVELLIGADLVDEAAERAPGVDAERLRAWAVSLRDAADQGSLADVPREEIVAALDGELATLVRQHAERRFATRFPGELPVEVDRERARFSAWYEFFPRSAGPGLRHGTFQDAAELLPTVREMGFDIVYLPPIHPIGRSRRKGPNNTAEAGPDDPGSPWAIGATEGGHTSVHPELGTLEDFRAFVARADEEGLEVALDLAFQCSPDHPWVDEHPEWFRTRPDGTVQYAENPPKLYQDIYPFDFETEAWPELWKALKGVVDFWIEQGVRVFRVDNPHTKPLPFWEWMISAVRDEHPDVFFLSEAFTRPKLMYALAKAGFGQSYTYFTWRNTKLEIEEYLTELTRPEVADFIRPSFWPNTPDILPEFLQLSGQPGFVLRLVLAATLSSSYGIYGPAFESMEVTPREPGSEEYLDSEKYEIREWPRGSEGSLRPVIARMNRIRRENSALHQTRRLTFHPVDQPDLLAFSKRSADGSNTILVVANLDPHHVRTGWLHLDTGALGLDADEPFQVHDLLGGGRYLWHGPANLVELDPHVAPAHVFRIARKIRTERDFDYFI